MKKHILVIAPHADDEVLGCAGAIQFHKQKGDTLSVIIVSNRILNHNICEEYIKKIKSETKKVQKLLKIDNVFYANLEDERLDHRLIDVIKAIEEVVSSVKPDIAYIPSENDTDQDHRAVAQASGVALRRVKHILVYEVPGPTKNFQANYYINIKKFIKNKIKAMTLYKDQLHKYPHPRSPKGIEIVSRMRGMDAGLEFAEAFRLLKWVQ
jgi:LmbE family N-acetylglucosaminyl deacetylase